MYKSQQLSGIFWMKFYIFSTTCCFQLGPLKKKWTSRWEGQGKSGWEGERKSGLEGEWKSRWEGALAVWGSKILAIRLGVYFFLE